MQNSEKFDSKNLKLQPVNLLETSRDTAGVHQRLAESLHKVFNVSSFVTTQPVKCNGSRPVGAHFLKPS